MPSTLKKKILNCNIKCKNLYVGSSIPKKKLDKALKSYAKHVNNTDVIALFDDTLFGSATEGFILTEKGFFSSYSYNNYSFNYIYDIKINDKFIVINDNIEFKTSSSLSELKFLEKCIKEHINENNTYNDIINYIDKIGNSINEGQFLDIIYDKLFPFKAGIFNTLNIPLGISKNILELLKHFDGNNIINNIHILISDYTTDDYVNQEVLFITKKYIYIYDSNQSFNYLFPLESINICKIKGTTIEFTFCDNAIFTFTPLRIDEDVAIRFFSLVKYYIDHTEKNVETNYDVCGTLSLFNYINDESNYTNKGDNKLNINKILSGTVDILSFNPFLKLLPYLNGRAIIIVVLLRNHAPEALDIAFQAIPGGNVSNVALKAALPRVLEWMKNQIIKHGEDKMMKEIIGNFKKRNIKKSKLKSDITSNLNSIFGEEVISESLILLDKYIADEDIYEENIDTLNNEIYDDNQVDDVIICPKCETSNNQDHKFCSNCGTKLSTEYTCNKCGYSQQNPMKFCPECGNPI